MSADKEKDLQEICKAIMKTYQDKMHEYLNSKPDGELTDSDVIVMIMNLTIGISSSIYYTLKQILPNTKMDFDFMRVKMCNALADEFDAIKDYSPKDTMMPLTVEQVKEVQEKGFTIIQLADGKARKVTRDEIMVKKEDATKLLDEAKEKALDIANTPKIITESNGLLRGK